MANYIGIARTNQFRIKDEVTALPALRAAVAHLDVEVVTYPSTTRLTDLTPYPDGPEGPVARDESGRFTVAILGRDENGGGWPTDVYDEDTEDLVEVDLPALVAPFLAEGSVAVFYEVGFEKLRYLTGYAIAVNSNGTTVLVGIEDAIKNAAANLGDEILSF